MKLHVLHLFALLIFIIILTSCVVTQPKVVSNSCSYDRDKILSLDQRSFDQDMNGGWRAIANVSTCMADAADLIRDYRLANDNQATILYWHEGQLRASLGEYSQAIILFNLSRHAIDDFGWNLYVDASIAFLNNDLNTLMDKREELAMLPMPNDFDPRDANGNRVDTPWPPNLNVVDRLITCFGYSYQQAYSSGCSNN